MYEQYISEIILDPFLELAKFYFKLSYKINS